MFATDRELPVTDTTRKRAYVRGMFTAIAPRYDLLNHVLSLNIDRRWRRVAVDRLGWMPSWPSAYQDMNDALTAAISTSVPAPSTWPPNSATARGSVAG